MIENEFNTWKTKLIEWNCIHDNLNNNLKLLYENEVVYPYRDKIFRAFRECDYNNVKVIIFSQDPYHNTYNLEPSACGLSFATENGYTNPSLRNIFKEIENEYGSCKVNNNLLSWCKQGVLLLNKALTVEAGNAGSHIKIWESWTSNFIKGLSKDKKIIWLLMGKEIQKLENLITDGIILKCGHPASEIYGSGTFFNSDIFKEVNNYLTKKITWNE